MRVITKKGSRLVINAWRRQESEVLEKAFFSQVKVVGYRVAECGIVISALCTPTCYLWKWSSWDPMEQGFPWEDEVSWKTLLMMSH